MVRNHDSDSFYYPPDFICFFNQSDLILLLLPRFGKEWCSSANPNLITTTSASPPFLLSKREEAALHLFNDLHIYHIIFISLLNTFEYSDYYQNLRKARAVCRWPPL